MIINDFWEEKWSVQGMNADGSQLQIYSESGKSIWIKLDDILMLIGKLYGQYNDQNCIKILNAWLNNV